MFFIKMDSTELSLYDVFISYLINEGYAESLEAAEVMMVNMSEDWRNSIIEEVSDEYMRRSAATSSAKLEATKKERLKAQKIQSKSMPIYRHKETGERVVTDTKGNFFIGKQRIDPTEVKTIQ